MLDFIKNNYTWLFSGGGIAIISVFYYFFRDTKKEKPSDLGSPEFLLSANNAVTVNNYLPEGNHRNDINVISQIDYAKKIVNILFIDDDTKFKVVTILKKSGWINTKMVKDVDSLDNQDVKETHIFFVDIQGVGKALSCKDEGLGLALSLKKKYPDKKVVIYSSETKGERFHEGLRKADSFLSKNAEPYEFLQLVEQFVPEII